jgi:hypothetical protein
MSAPVVLKDGHGGEHRNKVYPKGESFAASTGIPPYGYDTETRLFRDFFRNNGSSDMRVDGSTTNVAFTIDPSQASDRYIKTVSFVIADDGASLDAFGAIAALTNGVSFFYEDNLGARIINDELKTNWDFVRLSGGQPAFGSGTTVFKASNVEGKVDAYIPVLNFQTQFGFPNGLRLEAGSSQKLTLLIRDNTSGIDSFNAVAYGFDRLRSKTDV